MYWIISMVYRPPIPMDDMIARAAVAAASPEQLATWRTNGRFPDWLSHAAAAAGTAGTIALTDGQKRLLVDAAKMAEFVARAYCLAAPISKFILPSLPRANVLADFISAPDELAEQWETFRVRLQDCTRGSIWMTQALREHIGIAIPSTADDAEGGSALMEAQGMKRNLHREQTLHMSALSPISPPAADAAIRRESSIFEAAFLKHVEDRDPADSVRFLQILRGEELNAEAGGARFRVAAYREARAGYARMIEAAHQKRDEVDAAGHAAIDAYLASTQRAACPICSDEVLVVRDRAVDVLSIQYFETFADAEPLLVGHEHSCPVLQYDLAEEDRDRIEDLASEWGCTFVEAANELGRRRARGLRAPDPKHERPPRGRLVPIKVLPSVPPAPRTPPRSASPRRPRRRKGGV